MTDPGPHDENAEVVEIPWWAAWPLLLVGFVAGMAVGMVLGILA